MSRRCLSRISILALALFAIGTTSAHAADECVLQEHWAGSQGGKGESYNVYDAARGVWHQTWVDDSGNSLLLDGRFENGKMVLSGTQTASGKPVINRITWTPVKPGEVEQLWESSTDDGKTWTEQFLGIYRPRKP